MIEYVQCPESGRSVPWSNLDDDKLSCKNLIKLEASVTSLIENAASDKSQVSTRLAKIESNVISVKTGLGAKIDHVVVSKHSYFL